MTKCKVSVDRHGTIRWRNAEGQLHCEYGPAVEYLNGYKAWLLNGQRHREDGPAIEYCNGTKEWWLNGKHLATSEIAEPMTEYQVAEGERIAFWRNAEGQLHREDGPAVLFRNGAKTWYRNGQLHREDGPAVEYSDGGKIWYLDGKSLTEEEFLTRTAKKPEEIIVDGVVYRRAD